jgi:predicted HD phosphohydrolase
MPYILNAYELLISSLSKSFLRYHVSAFLYLANALPSFYKDLKTGSTEALPMTMTTDSRTPRKALASKL